MLECLEEPFLGGLVPGQPPVALAQQMFEFRHLGNRGLALRILRGVCKQVSQMALGVAVALELEGEIGTPAFEFRVAGVISESLFVDQEDLFAATAVGIPLIHELSVTFPRGSILAAQTEVLAQRLLGLFQFVAGLEAGSTAKQSRRVPPDLEAVHKVHAPGQQGHGREQDRQQYQVESSHNPDRLQHPHVYGSKPFAMLRKRECLAHSRAQLQSPSRPPSITEGGGDGPRCPCGPRD